MGRPRKVFSNFRVVVPVDRSLWESIHEVARKEGTSVTRLARALFQSYLERPARRVVYQDPLLLVRAENVSDYPVAVRQCVGWLETSDQEKVVIRYDEAVTKIPNGKEPAGPSFLQIPRRCVVDERRTTFP